MRQTLWQLQSALGSQNEPINDRVLLVEPVWIQLNLQADLWLDVAVLEQAFNLVQKASGYELDLSSVQALQHAVQLYQGPLLEGWYQDWCLYERERLQSMYLAMLDKLMSYCDVYHDYETGLLYGMRILCYDRARERTHRQLMRLYYLLGDRAEALRQYERCATALDEELNVSPSKSTIALYKQIQADQLAEPERILALNETNISLEVSTTPLIDILGHLAHLQESLADLQNEVEQSIQKVELVLKNYQ